VRSRGAESYIRLAKELMERSQASSSQPITNELSAEFAAASELKRVNES
jgi:hypothetical protein